MTSSSNGPSSLGFNAPQLRPVEVLSFSLSFSLFLSLQIFPLSHGPDNYRNDDLLAHSNLSPPVTVSELSSDRSRLLLSGSGSTFQQQDGLSHSTNDGEGRILFLVTVKSRGKSSRVTSLFLQRDSLWLSMVGTPLLSSPSYPLPSCGSSAPAETDLLRLNQPRRRSSGRLSRVPDCDIQRQASISAMLQIIVSLDFSFSFSIRFYSRSEFLFVYLFIYIYIYIYFPIVIRHTASRTDHLRQSSQRRARLPTIRNAHIEPP